MAHNNSETRHKWKGHLVFENGNLIFKGVYCSCGAYIMACVLAGVLNHYSGNDISVGAIEDRILRRDFDAKSYEESLDENKR